MTNPLADLEARMRIVFPKAFIEHPSMKYPERVDMLDIRSADRLIAMMWTPADGICITEVDDNSVFDSAPDFVVNTADEALQVLKFLMSAGTLHDADNFDLPPRMMNAMREVA
jgi:hypothetical protein